MKKVKILHNFIIIGFFFFNLLFMQNCCDCQKSNFKFYPPTKNRFPLLEITGKHYQIGYAIGRYFKKEIHTSFKIRKTWFKTLKSYIKKDNHQIFLSLKAKAEAYFPHLIDELSGMAAGSGIPFDDLFLLNIKAEVSAKNASEEEPPGCSTIHLITGKQKWLFHNEDGNIAYRNLMFIVKATVPSGVTFLTLCYPGYLMGNGPSLNSHGLIQTTNFISGLNCKNGIPRYFLGRAVLEAISLDDALRIATHPDRAFAYHHNLASFSENRILSLEVTPDNYHLKEPDFIYVHTNHLILDQTKSFPQETEYVNLSSISRYDVITNAIHKLSGVKQIGTEDIFKILSSHRNSPYSPCRHPSGDVRGITLATAVIDVSKGRMTLYKGNPCQSFRKNYFSVYSIKDLEP